MKLKSSLRRLCSSCYMVRRQASHGPWIAPLRFPIKDDSTNRTHSHCPSMTTKTQGRLFVYCKSNPRHKQRQGRGARRKLHTLGLEEAEAEMAHDRHHHHAACCSNSFPSGPSLPHPLIPASPMASWLAMATPILRSLGVRLRTLFAGGAGPRP